MEHNSERLEIEPFLSHASATYSSNDDSTHLPTLSDALPHFDSAINADNTREGLSDDRVDHADERQTAASRTGSGERNGLGSDEMNNNTAPHLTNVETIGLRRSNRIKELKQGRSQGRSPSSMASLFKATKAVGLFAMQLSSLPSAGLEIAHQCYATKIASYNEYLEKTFDDGMNGLNPVVFSTSITDNEVYNLNQMKKQPDRAYFEDAMVKEMKALLDNQIIEVVPRREMIDYYNSLKDQGVEAKRQQLMFIWSFKRKMHPYGSLNKHKARLCCHGGQQELGVNYWDTYAPVVSWTSVRTMLIISKIHKLYSKSIDFTLAYSQAPIKSNAYLFAPAGMKMNFQGRDCVLKLRQNLCGLKDGGRTW